MSEKNGGPAFPQIVRRDELNNRGNYVSVLVPEGGMTLRDYFAANCGLTVQLHIFTGSDGQMEILDPSSVTAEARQRIADWKAEMSYQIADAMLETRKS